MNWLKIDIDLLKDVLIETKKDILQSIREIEENNHLVINKCTK